MLKVLNVRYPALPLHPPESNMMRALPFLLLAACAREPSTDTPAAAAPDTAATPDEPFTPTLPTAQCGMPEYTWRSAEELGTLVAFEEQEGLSFSKAALQTLITTFGVADQVGDLQNGVQTYFVRYQTQDRGELVEATGMIVYPDLTGEVPVLLWLHPTMGFSDDCAPTAIGIEGAALPLLLASMGFIVVAPDYLGMSGYAGPSEQMHPYIVAEPTAVASLDALRALDRLQEAVSPPVTPARDRLVMWGASQGGFAALWADRFLPHYLPSYTAVGSIAAIPATDMTGLARHGVTVSGETSAAVAAAQVTMHDWYRSDADLDQVFVNGLGEVLADVINTECEDFSAMDDINTVEDIFTPEYIAGILAEDLEPWMCFLEESTLRESTVPHANDTPTLMVLAEEDSLAIADYARADIEALCAQGYRIEHLECAGLGHVDGAVTTLLRQLDWARARVDGDAWDASRVCVINEPEDCEEGEQ